MEMRKIAVEVVVGVAVHILDVILGEPQKSADPEVVGSTLLVLAQAGRLVGEGRTAGRNAR